MEAYLFDGVVHPERAQISLEVSLAFEHLTSGIEAEAKVSIIKNQVAVWVDSKVEWDIFDLRNVVKSVVQNELAIVGYLIGHAYEVEIRRVLNRSVGVDYVFGIDIPCISGRKEKVDLKNEIPKIRQKVQGLEGVYIQRCFADLVSAMKNADETGFYCYRAIESLRQHCAVKYKLRPDNKQEQWEKLREIAACDEATVRYIKAAADPVRHGGVASIAADEREKLLKSTWNVVDGYLNNS
jgi:hypothetical protein